MIHPETPHTAFIPLGEVRRRSPEIRLVEGVVGPELSAKLDDAVATDYRLTETERPVVAERVHELVRACTLNQPVLLLNWPMGGERDLAAAGYIGSEVSITDGQLYLEIYTEAPTDLSSPNDAWAQQVIQYDLSGLIDDAAAGRMRLVVGEPAVRAWLARRSLALARVTEPTNRQIHSDMVLLCEMTRAHLPFSHLNLDASQTALAAAHCENVLLAPHEFVLDHPQLFRAYERLHNVTTDQQKALLYNRLVLQLADEAPVSYEESANKHILSVVHSIGEHMPVVQGEVEGLDLTPRARAAILMATMYRAASQREALAQIEIPPFDEQTEFPLGPWPENHMPHGFVNKHVSEMHIREDIAYLNYLYTTGVPVEVLELTQQRIYGVTRHIHRYMLRDAPRQDIPYALQAIEFLYGVHTEQDRRSFYAKDFLYTIARAAPTSEYNDYFLGSYIMCIEALISRLPEEFFSYNDPPLTGRAAVAGLLADIYKLRADSLVASDLSRLGLEVD